MTSALCCLAIALLLILLVRSMFVIFQLPKDGSTLLVMALSVDKIAPESHRTPLPCGKDVVYTKSRRDKEVVHFC